MKRKRLLLTIDEKVFSKALRTSLTEYFTKSGITEEYFISSLSSYDLIDLDLNLKKYIQIKSPKFFVLADNPAEIIISYSKDSDFNQCIFEFYHQDTRYVTSFNYQDYLNGYYFNFLFDVNLVI